MAIEQQINIKMDVQGAEKVERGASTVSKLKKASEEVADLRSSVLPDTETISASSKQLNVFRRMKSVFFDPVVKTLKKVGFPGTKSAIKNLEKQNKEMKKMRTIVEDIGDEKEDQYNIDRKNRREEKQHVGAAGLGVATGAAAVAGRLGAGDVTGAAIGGIQQAGGGLRRIGAGMGGKFGGLVAGAGTGGLIGAAIAATIGGLERLFTGAAREVAPRLRAFERATGPMTERELGGLGAAQYTHRVQMGGIITGLETARGVLGQRVRRGGVGGNVAEMMDILGVSGEEAGRYIGLGRRFGGRAGIGALRRVAGAGGYEGRMDVFMRTVNQLTESMQNMGISIGSEAGAEMVGYLGRFGETFRGAAGGQIAMGAVGGIRGAQRLQSPADAMIMRALWTGDFESTMARMDKAGPKEMEAIRKHLKTVFGKDVTSAANVLMNTQLGAQLGIRSREAALTFLGGPGGPVGPPVGGLIRKTPLERLIEPELELFKRFMPGPLQRIKGYFKRAIRMGGVEETEESVERRVLYENYRGNKAALEKDKQMAVLVEQGKMSVAEYFEATDALKLQIDIRTDAKSTVKVTKKP